MKEIPLTHNKIAIVDDDDYDSLVRFKWHLATTPWGLEYARTNMKWNGKYHGVRMHRFILGLPDGVYTDHINHNGLDNRKSNLRVCNNGQNMMNKRAFKGTSKYKGVSWHKRDKLWQSYITFNKKRIHLGQFVSETRAALTYNMAAKILFGEFAYLNNIQEEI